MSEKDDTKEEESLNTDSKAFRGPGNLFPLNPKAPGFEAAEITYDTVGYTAPEKVHELKPEVHMEFNNQPS